ncbi:tRNA-splicing endonuclease subunit Sen2-1-like [Silene latifolia]|uniref:tRNA-splicing endonuclease subunit Sen2-1-like n=1 Tax=Silene latifolia TaxID=37657 RepID=UPI003D77C78E
MGPRWKGKGSKAKAAAEPMSEIILALQSSLTTSKCKGLISGCSVLLEADSEQSTILNRACFGRAMVTSQKEKQWYELGLEEAFYLCYSLKYLEIVDHDSNVKSDVELWDYMCSQIETFPEFYKGYSHLRMKNWVVRPGSQYGVDFVAYRHHPALVHSEYAVLVLSEKKGNSGQRLKLWSDLHCTLRLCGGVAKTLLVLHVQDQGSETGFPGCLKNSEIKEQTISRWLPEKTREQNSNLKNQGEASNT